MKYAVSSYSYAGLTRSGAYTEPQLIALAKDMGFDAIEFAEIHPPEGEDKTTYAARLREESERVGLPILCYAIGANFARPESEIEQEIARVCGEVDVAAILGCSLMRHDVAYGLPDEEKRLQHGFDSVLARLIRGCRAVTTYAAEKQIKTMSENHGTFCQESARVERLVTGVQHPNYGLLLDMGNFLCADEAPEAAFGKLAPYAFHVHAKDFHVKSGDGVAPQGAFFTSRAGNYLRGAIIGHGNVPVYQCLRILKQNGYAGSITVEFEGIEDPVKGVSYGLDNLKYMAETAGL